MKNDNVLISDTKHSLISNLKNNKKNKSKLIRMKRMVGQGSNICPSLQQNVDVDGTSLSTKVLN